MISFFLALLFFAPADLPTGETVIAKYIEATGGRQAYEQVHSTVAKGTMALPSVNIKGTVTIYESAPSQQVSVVEIPGVGKVEEGTDGKIAWHYSALEGARLKEGEEKEAAIRAASSETKLLDWKKFYKSITTAGMEDVDGKPAYKVVLTPLTGKPETEYYDKANNLLVKQTATVATPMGEIAVQTLLSDYRKEGGILIPHQLQQSAAGQKFTITIESVEVNPVIPKERFEPPEDVKALIK